MKINPRPYLYLLFLLLGSHAAVAQQKVAPKLDVQYNYGSVFKIDFK